MHARLITLERWAEATYGDDAPHVNTLRRWARDGLILPAPEKHGRTYYVRPDAHYVDPRSIDARPVRPSGAGRLVDRIPH